MHLAMFDTNNQNEIRSERDQVQIFLGLNGPRIGTALDRPSRILVHGDPGLDRLRDVLDRPCTRPSTDLVSVILGRNVKVSAEVISTLYRYIKSTRHL